MKHRDAEELLRKCADQQSEIARMRPVFRAAMRCLDNAGRIVNDDMGIIRTTMVFRLERACARAKHKPKRRGKIVALRETIRKATNP